MISRDLSENHKKNPLDPSVSRWKEPKSGLRIEFHWVWKIRHRAPPPRVIDKYLIDRIKLVFNRWFHAIWVKITKKIPSTPVYLDERSRNPVSELNFIEFEKFATGRHPRGSKCRHRGPFRWRPRFATEWTTTIYIYELTVCLCIFNIRRKLMRVSHIYTYIHTQTQNNDLSHKTALKNLEIDRWHHGILTIHTQPKRSFIKTHHGK